MTDGHPPPENLRTGIHLLRSEERLCADRLQKHLSMSHSKVIVLKGADPPDLEILVDVEIWGVEVAGLIPVRSAGSEVLPEFAFIARSERLPCVLEANCPPGCFGTYRLLTDGELSRSDCRTIVAKGTAFVASQVPGRVDLLPDGRATLERVRADGAVSVTGGPVHGSDDIRLDQRRTIATELADKLPKLEQLRGQYDKVGLCFWTDNSWHEEWELRGALEPHLVSLKHLDFIYVAISVAWHDAHLVTIYP